MHVAGVVIFRPDRRLLEKCLSGLRNAPRIFVFANGPVDDDVIALLSGFPQCDVKHASQNLGLAAGLNDVIRRAQASGAATITVFDQDSSPDPDMLADLARIWRECQGTGKRIAAVGPRLVPPDGENFRRIVYRRRGQVAAGLTEVDYLPTSGTSLSLDAWQQVGPFREDFFIDAVDIEWCYRARAHDFCCAMAEHLSMVHRWGVPSDDDRRTNVQIVRQPLLRAFYYLRNTTHCLRLPHLTRGWKLRQSGRIAFQVGALLVSNGMSRRAVRVARLALVNGWRGRLGPAPAELLSD